MKINGKFVIATSTLAFIALTIAALSVHGQGGNLIARSQLRRTVDPSERAAYGSLLLEIDAQGKETYRMNVQKLGEDNFGMILRDELIHTTNIVPGLYLPPLDRTNVRRGTWMRTLVGTGQAPEEMLPFADHLIDLTDTEVDVAQPGTPPVTTIFTNIVAGMTNISMGVTNIVGNTTNIINGIVIPNPGQTSTFFSVMWAPMPALTAKPSLLSFHKRGELTLVGTASPNASGTIKTRFEGNSGRSVLQIRATGLTSGQQYTFWVANSTNLDMTVMIVAGEMTQKQLGPTATFVRDTQFGDPLPQQARDIGDLSGRLVEIRDAFDVVHLQGFMP